MPEVLHSDQGWFFEGTILQKTLETFGFAKSHTTAYHPQGDGMVECMNRSLLPMFHCFVEKQHDWEHYFMLVI